MKRREATTVEHAQTAIASRFSAFLPPEESADFLGWGKRFLPHYFTHEPSRMHQWMAKRLEKMDHQRGLKYALIGPRRGAKSTIISLTSVLRDALKGREPYTMIVSDTAGQAAQHIAAAKHELESNEEIRNAYPNAYGVGPVWQHSLIQLRNGCVIHGLGTGSRIRGRKQRQDRPSKIVLDDPENDRHVSSETMRRRVQDWFYRSLMPMGDENTNFIVLGTALGRQGLVLGLLNKAGWKSRRIDGKAVPFKSLESMPDRMDLWDRWENLYLDVSTPHYAKNAKAFFIANRDLMVAGAKILWPARDTLYQLMTLRAELGHQAFESEHQGNPIDPSTCEWPEEYFMDESFWFDNWPRNVVVRTMALDPSKGKNVKRGDYSAIAKVAITDAGVVYCDFDMEVRTVDKIVSDSVKNVRSFRPNFFGVESNQFQELLKEDIANELESQHVECDVFPIENYGNKNARIRRLSPLLSKRRIRFKRTSPGALVCLQQLKDFPNGDHDDGPDALEMAIRSGYEFINGQQDEETNGIKVIY